MATEHVDGYEVSVSQSSKIDDPRISIRCGGQFIQFSTVFVWQEVKYKIDKMVEEIEECAKAAEAAK